ncbi:MAG: hypothetical protein HC836_50005 [Richelia sp. RM2_1_2]|nr:hypothetical protein [Richelia sp. RM2_1_2]
MLLRSLFGCRVDYATLYGIVYRVLTPEVPIAGLGIAWKPEQLTPVLSTFLENIRNLTK